MSVIIVLADGVRPDTLRDATSAKRGQQAAPAMAQLRDEGALCTVTSCFPSVTGPAYAPFLMGRHPASIGLPGLRWYDRRRDACAFPTFSRSYIGHQMRKVDRDLDLETPTMFELAKRSVGAMSVINRGLEPAARVGAFGVRGVRALVAAARVARTHFRGDLAGWLRVDRDVADTVVRRVREERPDFVFVALPGIDKMSHAEGHESPRVLQAIGVVDDMVARLRADAERLGYWNDMHLWITSDHGHSRVRTHDDLARAVADLGYRVMAHPWILTVAPEVAMMVSGNAMAHLYVELRRRERAFWPALRGRWSELADALQARASVDVMLLPHSEHACEVRAPRRGSALVTSNEGRYCYRRLTGDPLGLGGDLIGLDAEEALDATADTDYPDGLVQIATLAGASRSGDIILSASRDWDLRARFEPIPHVSSHGALHRDHMLVPLLLNRPLARPARRTVDVMPSALAALGIPSPAGLDGRSFLDWPRKTRAA